MTLPTIKTLLLAAAALALSAAPAAAQSPVSTPSAKTLYQRRPVGPLPHGRRRGCSRSTTRPGRQRASARRPAPRAGRASTVPNAWNASDNSRRVVRRRRRLVPQGLPAPERDSGARLGRALRVGQLPLEGLAQRPADRHEHAAPTCPFEIRLPAALLKRGGVNRLVDPRRQPAPADRLPAVGPVDRPACRPAAGGTTAACCARSTCGSRPHRLQHRRRPARPPVRDLRRDGPLPRHAAQLRRRGAAGARHRRASARATVNLGTQGGRRQALRDVHASVAVANPRLWSPTSPTLYNAPLTATLGRRARSQRYTLRTGIRSIKVVGGRLFLNGRPLNFRGVALHEDSKTKGFAIDNARPRPGARVGQGARRDHASAATTRCTRTRRSAPTSSGSCSGRRSRSTRSRRSTSSSSSCASSPRASSSRDIDANGNHPSVIVWSIGNELERPARPGAGRLHPARRERARRRSTRRARSASPSPATRPPAASREYGPLDVIGVNDYFGWYPGPDGQIADRTLLSDYLDQVRACYPNKAIVVTEFGAEANRDGPVEEKGTYAFQQDFVNYHLGVYATKPWLSGAIYWALQEFRVRPDWDGGNPRPNPPIHQKGLVTLRRRARSRRSSTCSGSSARRADRRRRRRASAAGRAAPSPATISRRPWPAKRPSSTPEPREPGSSRATRRLRREGRVPGVLYGGGDDPVAFDVDARELRHALAARGAVLELAIGGDTTPAVLKDAQLPPGARRDAARRPPARRLDVAIQRGRPPRPRRRRGGPRRRGGRRARARHARAQHRGAARRHPRVDPATTSRTWRSTTRVTLSALDGADGRHAPRRPRRDRHRDAHPADARHRAEDEAIEEETELVGEGAGEAEGSEADADAGDVPADAGDAQTE